MGRQVLGRPTPCWGPQWVLVLEYVSFCCHSRLESHMSLLLRDRIWISQSNLTRFNGLSSVLRMDFSALELKSELWIISPSLLKPWRTLEFYNSLWWSRPCQSWISHIISNFIAWSFLIPLEWTRQRLTLKCCLGLCRNGAMCSIWVLERSRRTSYWDGTSESVRELGEPYFVMENWEGRGP